MADGAAVPDMRLELIPIPVSDVDRAKKFYERLGWRLDDDVAPDGIEFWSGGAMPFQ